MDPLIEHHLLQTRRQFFGSAGLRVGGIALAHLMGRLRPWPLRLRLVLACILRSRAFRILRRRRRR